MTLKCTLEDCGLEYEVTDEEIRDAIKEISESHRQPIRAGHTIRLRRCPGFRVRGDPKQRNTDCFVAITITPEMLTKEKN